MSIVAEWLFILGLLAPPIAVVLGATGLLALSVSRRQKAEKTQAHLNVNAA